MQKIEITESDNKIHRANLDEATREKKNNVSGIYAELKQREEYT